MKKQQQKSQRVEGNRPVIHTIKQLKDAVQSASTLQKPILMAIIDKKSTKTDEKLMKKEEKKGGKKTPLSIPTTHQKRVTPPKPQNPYEVSKNSFN